MDKKTQAGTNIGKVQQQNASAGQYGTEFASETDAQEVRRQNAASAAGQASQAGQYGTEFASETDVQEVKRQNQQSQGKAQSNSQG